MVTWRRRSSARSIAPCRRARRGSPTTTSESESLCRALIDPENLPINPNNQHPTVAPRPSSPSAPRFPIVRRYFKRRVREEFEKNGNLVGEEAAAALAKAKKDLAVIDRQVQVYSLFGSELRSVLEITKKP